MKEYKIVKINGKRMYCSSIKEINHLAFETPEMIDFVDAAWTLYKKKDSMSEFMDFIIFNFRILKVESEWTK